MPQKKTSKNSKQEKKQEEFSVSGDQLVKKVKALIKEGNIRKITIKNEKGEKILIIPVTIGVVGVVLAPSIAALGALAALIGKCTIVVEKK